MKKILVLGVSVVFVFVVLGSALVVASPFQATSSREVKVAIPTQAGFNISTFRRRANTFLRYREVSNGLIDFGELRWDRGEGGFVSDYEYMISVRVSANASSWRLAHQITPISLNGQAGGPNLDGSIEVTFAGFVKGAIYKRVPYSDSNKTVNHRQAGSRFFSIGYKIAGQAITKEKPGGQYSGTVTLTLYDDSV